jgi:hypothetical protein
VTAGIGVHTEGEQTLEEEAQVEKGFPPTDLLGELPSVCKLMGLYKSGGRLLEVLGPLLACACRYLA